MLRMYINSYVMYKIVFIYCRKSYKMRLLLEIGGSIDFCGIVRYGCWTQLKMFCIFFRENMSPGLRVICLNQLIMLLKFSFI